MRSHKHLSQMPFKSPQNSWLPQGITETLFMVSLKIVPFLISHTSLSTHEVWNQHYQDLFRQKRDFHLYKLRSAFQCWPPVQICRKCKGWWWLYSINTASNFWVQASAHPSKFALLGEKELLQRRFDRFSLSNADWILFKYLFLGWIIDINNWNWQDAFKIVLLLCRGTENSWLAPKGRCFQRAAWSEFWAGSVRLFGEWVWWLLWHCW